LSVTKRIEELKDYELIKDDQKEPQKYYYYIFPNVIEIIKKYNIIDTANEDVLKNLKETSETNRNKLSKQKMDKYKMYGKQELPDNVSMEEYEIYMEYRREEKKVKDFFKTTKESGNTTGRYYHKYLKYKQKYLKLKNKI